MDQTTTETAELAGLALSGDACPSCGAPLAADQRYCVACGERQGGARPRVTPIEALPPAPPAVAERRRRGPIMSSGATLIAGVATLLVAMAVGVLIGRSGTHQQQQTASAPVRVVTVPAAGAAATPTATADKSASTGGKAKGHKAGKAKKDKPPPVPVSETKQAAGSDKPPPVVKVGATGHGRGYKNGHFTGDFFGP